MEALRDRKSGLRDLTALPTSVVFGLGWLFIYQKEHPIPEAPPLSLLAPRPLSVPPHRHNGLFITRPLGTSSHSAQPPSFGNGGGVGTPELRAEAESYVCVYWGGVGGE